MKKLVLENQRVKDKDKRDSKVDYGDPKTNRGSAMRKIAELKKREIKMKNSKRVYKIDGMTVTVYGDGVDISIMDAPKEFDRIRAELNTAYLTAYRAKKGGKE